MILIIPFALLVYFFRNAIASFVRRFPLPYAFIFLSTLFGLFIEGFAILDNLKKPEAERILMSPHPLTDLAFGVFYYGLVSSAWYFLVRKYAFTKKEVFLLTGIVLGLFTEQGGKIFFGAIASVPGFLVALLVIGIYGIFPTLSYLVTEDRFSKERKTPSVRTYALAVLVLILQWALFGLFVLPFLKLIV